MARKIDKQYSNYKKISFSIIILISFFLILNSYFYTLNQNIIYDKLQGTNDFVNNILVVKIDDPSINSIGRWPWNRSVYADAINKLNNSSVIAFDVSFFEKSNDDQYLADVISISKNRDKIIMVDEITDQKIFGPIFDVDTGYANLLNDKDGIIRNAELSFNSRNSLTQEAYYKYFNKNFTDTDYGLNLIQKTSRPLIYYSGNNINSISFVDLFNKSIDVNALTKNKIVLIGATAPDLHDMFITPIIKETLTPGVFIHANILNSMFLKSFIFELPKLYLLFVILLLAYIFFNVNLTRTNVIYFLTIFILILIAIFVFFFYLSYYFDYLGLLFSLFLFFITNVVIFNLSNRQKKQYVSDVFNKYISKELLEQIMDNDQHLELGGKDKKIGILFSDIRNFTTISEKLNAKQILGMLNEFFNIATNKIMNKRGFIDKFIGDAIMALWNAPIDDDDYVNNMVISAIELKELVIEKESHMKQKYDIPFDIGIGINVDDVVVGNLGGEGKINYTAIGDGVNLASRLEGLTKNYGVKIIASENVINDSLFDKDRFFFRKLDIVKVKGKDKSIKIFELIGFNNGNKKIISFIEKYNTAFELMVSQQFDEAFKLFNDLYDGYNDKASLVMRERIVVLKSKTPEELKGWDGSFKFDSK